MPGQLLLPILMLVPLAGAVLVALFGGTNANSRRIALAASTLTFLLGLAVANTFNWSDAGTLQLTSDLRWVPAFGLSFGFGVDAISLWLILLTVLLMPLTIWGSFSAIKDRSKEFYFWLLVLQTAMLGTFLATDLIFFYICFEFTLVPLYFLIGIFGSTDRLRAARVFFLYTFTGSMLTFAGVLYVAWFNTTLAPSAFPGAGALTFHIATLYHAGQAMTPHEQAWFFLSLLAGFAVKFPLFPVHTWLPLAHTEAPTAGSVILAGVLLKLGTYGLLRFAIPMTPLATEAFAPWIAAFAIAGILYTALICWVQKDLKKLIAYSSVSHLGFCVLGMFALNTIGVGGSIMYMINHGLSTGALFLCVGMIYERFHTREMARMSGLARVMPVWATFMVFFTLASVGLPGLNGFVGEFLTLLGAFTSQHTLGMPFGAIAGIGMIFGAIYLLYMLGRVVWGPLKVPGAEAHDAASTATSTAVAPTADHADPHTASHAVADLSWREIGVLTPLAIACLVLGLYPTPMLKSLEPSITRILASHAPPSYDTARAPLPPASKPTDEIARPPSSGDFFCGILRPPEAHPTATPQPIQLVSAPPTVTPSEGRAMNAMLDKIAGLWPEISLLIGACLCLAFGLAKAPSTRKLTAWIAGLALLVAGVLVFQFPAASATVVYVKLAVVVVGLLLLIVAAAVPDQIPSLRRAEALPHSGPQGTPGATFDPGLVMRGEFFAFFLFSLAGVMLVAGATDLIWLFLALELTSLPTYVMVATASDRVEAQESAVKYFFLGAMAAAVFLYGFTLIYGATGSTEFPEITRTALAQIHGPGLSPLLLTGIVLSVVGIAFKIAAFPMHYYVADVYQGAATPVTAFLAFVPKTAGFVALMLILAVVGQPLPPALSWLLWVMAALTMTIGNVLGLLQTNVKRVLAYSSIAHSGYMLVGLIALDSSSTALGNGQAAVLFYLIAYGLATIGAFAVLGSLETSGQEAQNYDDITGLARRHPTLAAIMLVSVLSLIGLPPMVGFLGKIYLFGSAIHHGYVILVVIAVVNSAVSAVYYLRIASACYFGPPNPHTQQLPSNVRPLGAAIAALAALALGIFGYRLVDAADLATGSGPIRPHSTLAVTTSPQPAPRPLHALPPIPPPPPLPAAASPTPPANP